MMRLNTILAGLTVLLAPFTVATYCSEQSSFTAIEDIPRLFEGFTPANIQYVVLEKQKADQGDVAAAEKPGADEAKPVTDRLVMAKKDDEWIIADGPLAGVPVRGSKVQDDVLEHLREIRRDEDAVLTVDATDEQLAERGLDPAHAIVIHALNAEQKPMAELRVGKDASGGEWGEDKVKGYFVARNDRKDIILYEPGTQFWNLSVKPEDWVDTVIHRFEADNVQSFSLRNDHGQVTFKREGGEAGAGGKRPWTAENAPEGVGPVRQSEVDNLVSRFAYMTVQRYLGDITHDPRLQAQVGAGAQPSIEVSAVMQDGKTHGMKVYGKIPDKNEYYARFTGADHDVDNLATAVGDWVVSSYEKDIQDLFDPAGQTPETPADGGEQQGAPKTGQAPSESDAAPATGGGASGATPEPAAGKSGDEGAPMPEKPPSEAAENEGPGSDR